MKVRKRDGRVVAFNRERLFSAISRAYHEVHEDLGTDAIVNAVAVVANSLEDPDEDAVIDVEEIQDSVVKELENSMPEVAEVYKAYREKRAKVRESNSNYIKNLERVAGSNSLIEDEKRSNANIDGDSAMGTMLQIGSEASKTLYLTKYIPEDIANAHLNGDIHIHDLDFYKLTMTCCQIDIKKLFKDGFSTGHGTLREPQSIQSYAALAAIAIQSNQNDQHGGQSIPAFDYYTADGVRKSYKKNLELVKEINPTLAQPCLEHKAWELTKKDTHQAMEAFIANLNSMHSRAGAQVPFSSINYGTDTSKEGRLVMEQLLLATEEGLGQGETPIFPIQIFKVKEGVNLNEGDPNYDLFKLACRVSCKRLFPNFSFLDAPFNKKYLKEGNIDSEVAYMGCRTRTIANIHDPSREIVTGRGNLSFTSINLPRLAIESYGNIPMFFKKLDDELELVAKQLVERLKVQSLLHPKNFPFLMGQGIWMDSDKLGPNDDISDILKHGSLSIGFIGLSETLVELIGQHHGETEEAQKLGIEIVKAMRNFCDKKCEELKLNFALIATPAEGLSGRFVKMDRKKYGIIPGVTDKEYYTNSFHITPGFKITAAKKIELEAPYHALTNGGHITYIEMDGDPSKNVEAFEKVVRYMAKMGIGYGAINHPVDRCLKCGHRGIIGTECPKCGAKDKEGWIERLRRITGYLVGTLARWNDAKKAEEKDRTKHKV